MQDCDRSWPSYSCITWNAPCDPLICPNWGRRFLNLEHLLATHHNWYPFYILLCISEQKPAPSLPRRPFPTSFWVSLPRRRMRIWKVEKNRHGSPVASQRWWRFPAAGEMVLEIIHFHAADGGDSWKELPSPHFQLANSFCFLVLNTFHLEHSRLASVFLSGWDPTGALHFSGLVK